ncbi:hypothetical protein QWY84_07985 [Aquisalimonas lutea]|uniref:hypothetical protein n=1 Tax=Aquisalimonas lutea TaxID=1327750 RepID=UPI0025B3E4CA|nr:hypothetical protein [Aquisalimonas lutea]MDN3517544.1 hypothetical protein [Aquisalimonas lutea]
MSHFQYFFLIACIIAGTAVGSKPHHSTFDDLYGDSVELAFGQSGEFGNSRLAREIAELKCRTAADSCESRIRDRLQVRYTDYFVANAADVSFEGHHVGRCVGLANMWLCGD